MNIDRVFNFTNTYVREDYTEFSFLDCSSITGTDMYCDDEAGERIKKLIEDSAVSDGEKPYSGIHLIDSGNYHYMTRLFTSFIESPYELVFFDNHTDMKPAMFDMLSCGSWAKAVLDHDKNIKSLLMIGPPEMSVKELATELLKDERLKIVTAEELSLGDADIESFLNKELPLYVSVDKDILSTCEVMTNWDQGELSLNGLLELIEKVCKNRRVLGADICGLLPENALDPTSKLSYQNGLSTDKEIIKVLKNVR